MPRVNDSPQTLIHTRTRNFQTLVTDGELYNGQTESSGWPKPVLVTVRWSRVEDQDTVFAERADIADATEHDTFVDEREQTGEYETVMSTG